MFRLGLTGSIGTGKSTTAAYFRALGVPVHDADGAVHRLYREAAAPLIAAEFPGAIIDGRVDRKSLGALVAGKPDRFRALEAIVHPLVEAEERAAIEQAKKIGSRIIVLDVPLLFETGADRRCNAVLVTHVHPEEQRRRVLARGTMGEALFESILARQMPLAEKISRAHFNIDTGHGMEAAQREIEALLRALAPALTGADMREIVLDTETTGLDPHRGDRLVEIGCVEMVNRFLTGKTFHRYINPERAMPIEAFQVHGLSEAFLSDKPVFAQVAAEFLEFIGEDTLVIHNANFDVGFLNAELKRLGKGPIIMARVIDTLTMARRKHPGAPASLDALCARYGIDNSRRSRHGALLDAEILAEVYAELTGGKQSSLGLDAAPAPAARRAGEGGATTSGQDQEIAHIPLLSEEERRAHRAFIAEMKGDVIWNLYLAAETTSRD